MKKPTQEMYVEQSTDVKKEKKSEPIVDSSVTNIVDLPSNGQLGYPSQINYREILVKDEEVLASATPQTYARTLNKVLKSITNDCDFFEKLTVHDRDFLLVWVWANNYSPTKRVSFKCPKCKTESEHTIDFTKQNSTELNKKFKGFFEMPIKKLGTNVSVRMNTVADEMRAEEYIAKNPDTRYENLLLVQSIDLGVPNMPLEQRIKNVANNVSGLEMAKIKQFHIKLRYGIDPEVSYVCKNEDCGEVTKDAFPFHTEDILFPTIQADIEEFL